MDATAIVANLGLHLYETTLTAHQSPWGKALFARMKNPKPGDFVVIDHAPRGEPHTLVGTLTEIEQLRVDRDWEDETWDEEVEGRPCPTEPCYVLKLLDGSTFRWTNASPRALPRRRYPARRVIADWESLKERPATMQEQIESLFRAPSNVVTTLGGALR